jgi:hypothetical protein
MEPTKARPARPPARRRCDCLLARGDLARHQRGAQAQQQTILLMDEPGFYPLPSVARTYVPMGQTPIVREWCTRDHLSAISASRWNVSCTPAVRTALATLTIRWGVSSTCCARCRPDAHHLGWSAAPPQSYHQRISHRRRIATSLFGVPTRPMLRSYSREGL